MHKRQNTPAVLSLVTPIIQQRRTGVKGKPPLAYGAVERFNDVGEIHKNKLMRGDRLIIVRQQSEQHNRARGKLYFSLCAALCGKIRAVSEKSKC